MSTKHTDGCFHHAEDDEPLFTLLSRDPLAPAAVRDWAERAERKGWQPAERIAEARACADAMDAWRREHRPEKAEYVRPELPALLARLVAVIRSSGFDAACAVIDAPDADGREWSEVANWLGMDSVDDVGMLVVALALARVLPEEGAGAGGCLRCRVLEGQNQRLFEERSRAPVAMLADLMAAIRDAGGTLRISRESLGDVLHALADDALHVTREETPEGIELTLGEEGS